MLTASQNFKDNIYPTEVAREIRARAFVELFNPDQYDNIASLTFSENTVVGSATQLMNVIIESSRKYASLEPDTFKLDGSVYLVPDIAIPDTIERGWISESLSDDLGAINITTTLTFIAANKIKGISLHFDKKYDVTLSDCTLKFYNASNALLKTVTIVDNTSYIINATANLDAVSKVVINFTKLTLPYRRLRLVEFSPGMLLVYNDADIVDLTTTSEFDPFNNSLITPEATLSIRNEDRAIDILNTEGFEPYLQQKQKLRLFLGLITGTTEEYIHIGNYYLTDWKASPSTLTATFTARGWLDRVSNTDYTKSKYTGTDKTYYEVAETILIDAGIDSYVIDASLYNYYTVGIIPTAPHKELLRLIAQATNCMIYVAVSGTVYIKQIEFNVDGSLDQSQMPSPDINLDTAVNRLVVPVSYITVDTDSNKVASYRDILATTQTITITHDFTAIVTVKPTITGGVINSWTAYDNNTVVNITPNSPSTSVEVIVNGRRISSSTSDYILEDATAIAVSGIVEKKIDNAFITNNVVANNVAAYQMSLYQQRYLYNVSFRQNPLLEVGDILTMQDDFNKNYPVLITRNNISYAAYLSGTIDGRSVYNNVSS